MAMMGELLSSSFGLLDFVTYGRVATVVVAEELEVQVVAQEALLEPDAAPHPEHREAAHDHEADEVPQRRVGVQPPVVDVAHQRAVGLRIRVGRRVFIRRKVIQKLQSVDIQVRSDEGSSCDEDKQCASIALSKNQRNRRRYDHGREVASFVR